MIDTTLILLCHNRPNAFLRAVNYYENYVDKIKILILISGRINKKNYQLKKKKNFKVIFLNKNFHEKVNFGLKKIKTKYSLMCGVDDFILVDSIIACKKFLAKNHDYISCHGRYYLHKSFSEIKNTRNLVKDISAESCSIDQKEIINRAVAYLTNFNPASTNFYAVYKTTILKSIFKTLCSHLKRFKKDPTITLEMMFCLLSHMLGKTKHLNNLYSTKEKHISIPNVDLSLFEEKILLEDYVKFTIKKFKFLKKISEQEEEKIKFFLLEKFYKVQIHHNNKSKKIIIDLLKKIKGYQLIKEFYLNISEHKKIDLKYINTKNKKEINKIIQTIYKFPGVENEANLSRKLYVRKK